MTIWLAASAVVLRLRIFGKPTRHIRHAGTNSETRLFTGSAGSSSLLIVLSGRIIVLIMINCMGRLGKG